MRRQTRKQLPAMIAAGFAAIACIGGLGYLGYSSMGVPVADEFGCFDEFYSPQTIFILDSSQPRWDENQARSLNTFTDQTFDGLRVNERFSVFTTEADVISSVMKPRFSLCGQASSSAELEELTGAKIDTGYLKRMKEELYQKVLAPQLHKLFALEADEERLQNNQSPILEMIQSVTRLTQPEAGDHLVIISDLIQSSDSARFCTQRLDMPSYETFSKRRIWQRLKPTSLEGVKVTVLYLLRDGLGSTGFEYCRDEEEIKAFYSDMLYDQGVESVEFIRVRPALKEAAVKALTPKKPQGVAARAATSIKNAVSFARAKSGVVFAETDLSASEV